MSEKTHDKQNPAFYALLVALVVMAVSPIFMMLTTSMKLNVDIMSDSSSLLFMPTLRNYETALCDFLWYEAAHIDYCDRTFGRALIISLISTVITLVIGCISIQIDRASLVAWLVCYFACVCPNFRRIAAR